ncbi:unnamed protein product [Cyprideis torosa]|uniref:Uncharacterized protein n=1 Tax=Cyprideis torosa TaxID=163714 RepID=A0A7R8W9T0_9CRUS|nr:unnamed protein product [Cyprideis torosa]CAG0890165.1 unnamed protein product [Cyprideis torosa]
MRNQRVVLKFSSVALLIWIVYGRKYFGIGLKEALYSGTHLSDDEDARSDSGCPIDLASSWEPRSVGHVPWRVFDRKRDMPMPKQEKSYNRYKPDWEKDQRFSVTLQNGDRECATGSDMSSMQGNHQCCDHGCHARIMMGDSKRSINGVGDLFRKMFPDSEIARGFQMERDKGQYIAAFGLGMYEYFKNEVTKTRPRTPQFKKAKWTSRQGEYLAVVGETQKFPKKYCATRWTENVQVPDRALEMLPALKKYVDIVESNTGVEIDGVITKLSVPRSKSFIVIKEAVKNPRLEPRLWFFRSLFSEVLEYLTKFQCGQQVDFFMYGELLQIMKNFPRRIVKNKEVDLMVFWSSKYLLMKIVFPETPSSHHHSEMNMLICHTTSGTWDLV